MSITVDELVTIYKAKDDHSKVALAVAGSQDRIAKASEGQKKALEAVQRTLDRFAHQSDLTNRLLGKQSAELEHLARAYDKVDRSTGRAHASGGRFSAVMAGMTAGATNRVIGWLGGIQQGMGDFYNRSIEAAIGAESLQARLEALTGSRALAQGKLKMAELVAAPSPFTTKQLSNAAVTLEAFGLNAERFLPIIGRLGAAMGADEEKIQLYARALGELSTGKMIESEARAAMGVSIPEFQQRGVRFDTNNQLTSTATEAFAALEDIVNTKYGNIFEKMAGTAEAKRASLEDLGERALKIIGDGMLKKQGPMIDAFTRVLGGVVNSDALSQTVSRMLEGLTGLGGSLGLDMSGTEQQIARIAARVLTFAEFLPQHLQAGIFYVKDFTHAVTNNVSEWFLATQNTVERTVARISMFVSGLADELSNIPKSLAQSFMDTTKVLSSQAQDMLNRLQKSLPFGLGELAGPLVKQLQGLAEGTGESATLKALQGLAKRNHIDPVGRVRALWEQSGQMVDAFLPERRAKYLEYGIQPEHMAQYKGLLGNPEKRTAELEKMILGQMQRGTPGIPDVSGVSFFRGDDLTGKLEKIKEATEKTAKNTENLTESIFGGKRSKGISYADVMGGGAGRSGGISIKVDKAASTLGQALLEVLQENLPEITDYMSRRQGMAY